MSHTKQKIFFLGTGTSQGVPVIGSNHPVCLSKDKKDKRLRCSVMVIVNDVHLLIDCGPDFRYQMLRENISRIDAVLLTHEHNDHIIGLDDVRPVNFLQQKDMPIYAQKRVLSEVKNRFPYAFLPHSYPGIPRFELNEIKENIPFHINEVQIIPLLAWHGSLAILGYRIGNFAYLTDVSNIPNSTLNLLNNLDVLVVDALRKNPKHHSHLTLDEALDYAKKIKAKQTYFTHISHQMGFHKDVENELPKNYHLAYDQLVIDL